MHLHKSRSLAAGEGGRRQLRFLIKLAAARPRRPVKLQCRKQLQLKAQRPDALCPKPPVRKPTALNVQSRARDGVENVPEQAPGERSNTMRKPSGAVHDRAATGVH